jgi:hypothetical protein
VPAIFINYRNGDEEATATAIDQELRRRFGRDQVFRASRSIPPGEDYVPALLTAVRDSEVLLAVVGSRWLTAVDEQGRNRLENEADWIRREILEAFEHGVRVIPVLIGRLQPLLRPSDLPPELARLADCQYRRLDHRSSETDLRALGDELAELVPSLVDHDQPGDVVNDARGPVNTGSGHQFTGDGVNYVTGGNSGGIRQRFGSAREHPDEGP